MIGNYYPQAQVLRKPNPPISIVYIRWVHSYIARYPVLGTVQSEKSRFL